MKQKVLVLTSILLMTSSVLLAVPAHQAEALTGENGRIVYQSALSGGPQQLYSIRADGTDKIRLTNDSYNDVRPRYSPDGKNIVFSNDSMGISQIYVMNTDGSNQHRISDGTASDYGADYSPDGKMFVFDRTPNGSTTDDIYTMNSDGTSVRQLTTTASYDTDPIWSPDGKSITWRSSRVGVFDVFIMNADGTNQTQLTTGSIYNFTVPNFSADSKRVVYDTAVDANPNSALEIHTIGINGTGDVRLTNNPADDAYATYSPDGTKIVFGTNRDGRYQLYTMNTDGTNQSRITNNASDDTYMDWQPQIGTTTSDGSHVNTTVAANQSYPTVNYTLDANETLGLDGKLCNVHVPSGAILMGIGTACAVTIDSGGTIAPGHSPGCLTSTDLTLNGTYTAQVGGNQPCMEYDQLRADNSVSVSGSLDLQLLNGFKPKVGDTFILIANNSVNPTVGTFNNLPEGGRLVSGAAAFRISYKGGDGNDIILTTEAPQVVPNAPNTGFNLQLSAPLFTLLTCIIAATVLVILTRLIT